MNEIKALKELQAIDTKLKHLEELLGDLPHRVEELIAEEKQLIAALEADKARHKEIELQVSKTDLNLADIQTRIDTLKEQLYTVSTNRQYDALTHEIDHLKNSYDTLETEDIILLEEKGELEARIKVQEESLGTLTRDLAHKREAMEKQIQESSAEKSALENKRMKKVVNVTDTTLRRYDRVLEARDGLAVVSMNGSACSGCGASLTPQVAAEIRSGSFVHTCDICSRILIYEE